MTKTAARRPTERDPETANLFETAALCEDGADALAGGVAIEEGGVALAGDGAEGFAGEGEGELGCGGGGGVAFGDGDWAGGDAFGDRVGEV